MAIVPDECVRSNRKTLSICVDGQGRLIVRAPMRCGEEQIAAFLQEKEKWIVKKQTERRENSILLPSDNLDGYSFLLLGEKVTISLTEGKRILYFGEKVTISLTEGKRILYFAKEKQLYLPSDKPKERLVKWLKENAKRIFRKVTDEYAEKMGVRYTSISVTSARTRWGSCSANNVLRYTFRLLYCPRELIEYVVVHELAHIRYKNHSKAFWTEVEKFIPDCKLRRRQLKQYGGVMDIF